jgi:two-component SAPR family response regulator
MNKILIADNEQFFVENLCTYLAEFRLYAVDTCYDLSNAMNKAKFSKYDIAIIDINLDEDFGYDLADFVRGKSPHTQIILTSADPYNFNAKSYPDYNFIEKPFDIKNLLELINKKPINKME